MVKDPITQKACELQNKNTSLQPARVILPFLICRCDTCQCDFCQQTLDAFVIFSCVNIAAVYILPLYLKYHLTFCQCIFASVSQFFLKFWTLPCNLFLIFELKKEIETITKCSIEIFTGTLHYHRKQSFGKSP